MNDVVHVPWLAALFAVLLPACQQAETTCVSAADCLAGELCVAGFCRSGVGNVDASSDVLPEFDAAAADAASPEDAAINDDALSTADSSVSDGSTPDSFSVDAGAAPDSGADPLEDPTISSAFPLADPDTVLARDGSYVSYGTTVGAGRGERCGGVGKLYVPFLVHGSGSSVGISDCAAGDALPGGPGAWAEPGGSIWAPGVARFGDRYFMYYTASRRGTGQKCIGRAVSSSARGPFVSRGEWACPDGGRWAIDANPFVAEGRLHVAYRDDAITSFPDTGLSVVRTDDNGVAEWATRRDLLRSTDIEWETVRMSGTTRVIENPSLFLDDGIWYVAYSGNNWDSPRYATGLASCGSSPRPSSRCTPLRQGARRPYFGFTGGAGLDPYRGLPSNHQGPGGMDIFQAADGSHRAIWHWWDSASGRRHSAVGRLLTNAGGFFVGP